MPSRLNPRGWLLLLGIALGLPLYGCSAKPPPQVMLGSQATAMQQSGQGCVEPTAVMRRSHMDFLLHQRDATVHEGIRTVKHSLKACIDCHVSHDNQNQPVPINAEGQFCQACHAYAAVKLDCFECHATKPAPALATPVPEATPAVATPIAQTPGEPAPAVTRPEAAVPAVMPSSDLAPSALQPVPVATMPEN